MADGLRHQAASVLTSASVAQEQRLRVRAARLRVVLDRRLDRPTPEPVRRLAGQPLAGSAEAPAR